MRRGLTVVLACAGLLVAGCGSDADNSSSGGGGGSSTTAAADPALKQFQDAATAAQAPVTDFPGPDTGPTPVPKGKKMFIITCSSQGVGCVKLSDGIEEAAKELGWTTTVIDGKGNPQVWNGAIRTAITSKADAIAIVAVPPALVGDGLKRAKAAGIPVISGFNPPSTQASGVYAFVTPDHTAQGKAMADWIISDSGGKAKVVLVREDAFPEIKERQDAVAAELGKCSGCEIVATPQSELASLSNRFPGVVTSTLQAHPDAEYIVTPYDAASIFAGQAIRTAGKSGQVKITGFEGDPSAIDAIKKGDQAATIADPTHFMGWQIVNETVRALAKQKPTNILNKWRLFTKDNINEVKTDVYELDYDYRSNFKSLWTTGKSK
jgi:ribose transport system substrate-binding protein